jgi:hypothetical protein
MDWESSVELDGDARRAMRKKQYFPVYVHVVELFKDDIMVGKVGNNSATASHCHCHWMRVDPGSYTLEDKDKDKFDTGSDPSLGHSMKGTGFQWRNLSLTISACTLQACSHFKSR